VTAQPVLLIIGFGLVGFGFLLFLWGLSKLGAVMRHERPKAALVVPLMLAGATGLAGAGFVQLSLPGGVIEGVFASVNIVTGLGLAILLWRQVMTRKG